MEIAVRQFLLLCLVLFRIPDFHVVKSAVIYFCVSHKVALDGARILSSGLDTGVNGFNSVLNLVKLILCWWTGMRRIGRFVIRRFIYALVLEWVRAKRPVLSAQLVAVNLLRRVSETRNVGHLASTKLRVLVQHA